MVSASATIVPPSYYEGLADELDRLAHAIRKNPHLTDHFASRLLELANQMRQDVRLMRTIA